MFNYAMLFYLLDRISKEVLETCSAFAKTHKEDPNQLSYFVELPRFIVGAVEHYNLIVRS